MATLLTAILCLLIFSLLSVKFSIHQLADFLAEFYQPFVRFSRQQIPDQKPVSKSFSRWKLLHLHQKHSLLLFFMTFLIYFICVWPDTKPIVWTHTLQNAGR